MDKRMLNGAVDESLAEQQAHKSDETLHIMWKI